MARPRSPVNRFPQMNTSEREAQVQQVGDEKAEGGWTCADKGQWVCWTQDVDNRAARDEEKRKTTEKGHGCCEIRSSECV